MDWAGYNLLMRYLEEDCDLASVEYIVSLAGIKWTPLQNPLNKCAKDKQITALSLAVKYHSVALVKILVEAGANVN